MFAHNYMLIVRAIGRSVGCRVPHCVCPHSCCVSQPYPPIRDVNDSTSVGHERKEHYLLSDHDVDGTWHTCYFKALTVGTPAMCSCTTHGECPAAASHVLMGASQTQAISSTPMLRWQSAAENMCKLCMTATATAMRSKHCEHGIKHDSPDELQMEKH